MRLRNRRALQDKTPVNTPDATGVKKARQTPGPSGRKGGLEGRSSAKLPALTLQSRGDADEVELPAPKLPVESTPLAMRRSGKLAIVPLSTKRTVQQIYSPLPPSSPPSMSSELAYEDIPPIPRLAVTPISPVVEDDEVGQDNNEADNEDKENEFEEDKENTSRAPLKPIAVAPTLQQADSSSSDDPFGFSALERRLKAKREHKRRSSFVPIPVPHPILKDRGPARPRAPLGELSFDRVASTSAVKERAPTPYHESDDLEDMYLDPNTLSGPPAVPAPIAAQEDFDENESMSPPMGLEGLEEEMDEEEEEELEREQRRREKGKAKAAPIRSPTPVSENDALRTPRPQHVANIYPLRSPFSSREATPCDRSLADSAPSSPSPMKPLTVLRAFPVGSAAKSPAKKGKILAKARARPPLDVPPAKRRRVTLGKENDTETREIPDEPEDPVLPVKNLQKLMPEKPVRRSGRVATAAPTTRTPRSVKVAADDEVNVKRGRGRPPKSKVLVPDSTSDREEVSELEVSEESPTARKKRKAPAARNHPPTKKPRTQPPSSTRSAPASKRAKPLSGAQTRAKVAAKDKGKGKEKAGSSKLDGENSDEARARQARIEYFKKLDKFSLEEENVYII